MGQIFFLKNNFFSLPSDPFLGGHVTGNQHIIYFWPSTYWMNELTHDNFWVCSHLQVLQFKCYCLPGILQLKTRTVHSWNVILLLWLVLSSKVVFNLLFIAHFFFWSQTKYWAQCGNSDKFYSGISFLWYLKIGRIDRSTTIHFFFNLE